MNPLPSMHYVLQYAALLPHLKAASQCDVGAEGLQAN